MKNWRSGTETVRSESETETAQSGTGACDFSLSSGGFGTGFPGNRACECAYFVYWEGEREGQRGEGGEVRRGRGGEVGG